MPRTTIHLIGSHATWTNPVDVWKCEYQNIQSKDHQLLVRNIVQYSTSVYNLFEHTAKYMKIYLTYNIYILSYIYIYNCYTSYTWWKCHGFQSIHTLNIPWLSQVSCLGVVPLYNFPRWPSAGSEGNKASYCHHNLGMDVNQKTIPEKKLSEAINAVSFCTAV